MQARLVIQLFWLVIVESPPARAASFDCGKAASPIETTICESERVSRLDGKLGNAYRAAVGSSKDPAGITASQRAWIKERNKCRDEACLITAYEQRLAALAPTQRASEEPATPAASRPVEKPAPAAAVPELVDDPHDLIVYFARDSALKVVTAIDGSRRIANPEGLLASGYRMCILVQHPYSHASSDMLGLAERDFLALGRDRIRPAIDQAAGGTVLQVNVGTSCIENGRLGFPYPEVLAIPREHLSSLQETAFLVNDIQDKYDSVSVVRHSTIVQAAARWNVLREQAAVEDQKRNQRLDDLARADSRDHVASVNLSYPSNRSLNYCTLTYSGAHGAAMLGYAQRGSEWLAPAARLRVDTLGAKPTGASPYNHGYASLDEFYQHYQQKSADCHVYVDFPKNVKALMVAIERDQSGRKLELNEIVAAQDLRESWARHNGFADWRSSEFAESIKASADQLKALAAQGLRSEAGVAASMAEMRSAGYAMSSEVSELLAYLADKKSTGKGQTALSVKQEREQKERALAEQRQAQARAREAEYTRQFPYTATLSCGMGGRHLNILGCFTGKHVNTQLEVHNGDDYKLFQPWEISQYLSQSSEGIVIQLRSSFEIKAQNIDETLILTLRITENGTGRIVYQKSASQFGVVSVRN